MNEPKAGDTPLVEPPHEFMEDVPPNPPEYQAPFIDDEALEVDPMERINDEEANAELFGDPDDPEDDDMDDAEVVRMAEEDGMQVSVCMEALADHIQVMLIFPRHV